ncbi:MAG: methionyl-tRNA formyltransferase [Flavobacteriaceae bacterium]|nr:MAG: methionyl-tRNA formyltransferase [Flavobacteriaceae bacterium]
MNNFVILSEKKWNKTLKEYCENIFPDSNWILIKTRGEFTYEFLKKVEPKKIFIPHWSYIIPEKIFSNFECIVFHMTDLPYGRGGSPLQNLIIRGHKETKISALRVTKGIDEGPIYLKKELNLLGTAEEIFLRANDVIAEMIKEIIIENPEPKNQEGIPTFFKRRKPEQGDIGNLDQPEVIYNYIRMLDAKGYPKAFLETEYLKLEFSGASIESDKIILADVRIIKK